MGLHGPLQGYLFFTYFYLICQINSSVDLFTGSIYLEPELVSKLRFWTRNKSLKFTVFEAKRLCRNATLLNFTKLEERHPPPDCNWQLEPYMRTKRKLRSPAAKEKSLGDLNCRLKPPAIEINPGKAFLRVVTSAKAKHRIPKGMPTTDPSLL
jgi:hypothetical protein